MKTVKKLFSLLLVAVLLVAAIPFQASASEEETPLPKYVFFLVEGEDYQYASVGESMKVTPPAFELEGKRITHWTIGGVTYKANEFASKELSNTFFTENEDGTQLQAFARATLETIHSCEFEPGVVTPVTCTTNGYTTYECECGKTEQRDFVTAPGHNWGAWEVTTEPTDRAPGVETRECSGCDAVETREIPKNTTLVSFYSDESNESWDYNYELYQRITSSDLPAPKKVVGKKFVGWYDASGNRLQVGDTWSGQHSEYFARYIEGEDGLSTISVYARFYVDGVQQGSTTFLYDQTFEDGANVLNWLQTHESTTSNAIFSVKSSADYEWEPRYYYDYSGNEPLTSQDLIANGDKSIVVKVYAKSTARANVLLYVHNKVGSEVAAIYEMPGYTAGNTVTLSEAKTVIKNKTGKNYNVTGLYTDAAWDQLVAGQKPTASNGVKVSDNGTLRLHVVVSNFTAGSISTKPADSTNPATGDTIMMTAGIMAMSAAALVTLMELRKRKMI